jgi:hypothetical protein
MMKAMKDVVFERVSANQAVEVPVVREHHGHDLAFSRMDMEFLCAFYVIL